MKKMKKNYRKLLKELDKFIGLWVAIDHYSVNDPEELKIAAIGKSAEEVFAEVEAKGIKCPFITKVYDKNTKFLILAA